MRQSASAFGVALAIISLLGLPATAHAAPVFIDRFTVVKNALTIFDDTFDDGAPPPSTAPGSTIPYLVSGTLNEAGGKVRMDTQGAAIVPGAGLAAGTSVFFERALLLTNTDPASDLGLKSHHTFSLTGIFDLTIPTHPLEVYGIRFNDAGVSNGDDLVRLLIGPAAAFPELRVLFTRQVGSTVTLLDSGVLDLSHQQIALTLTKGDPGSPAVSASFHYIDGVVLGPVTPLGATADLFHGETFTRGEFLFATPVPEPASLVLIGLGLVTLGGLAHRRSGSG